MVRLVSRGLVLGVEGCVGHLALGPFNMKRVETETVLVSPESVESVLEGKQLRVFFC